jgi:hypothetical protein
MTPSDTYDTDGFDQDEAWRRFRRSIDFILASAVLALITTILQALL